MTTEPDNVEHIAKIVEIAGVAALTLLQKGYSLEDTLQNLPGLVEQSIRNRFPDTEWDFTPVEGPEDN